MYDIDSQVTIGGKLKSFSQEEVKNEPMLFSCDLENAYHKGGPITKNFLEAFFGDTLFEGAGGLSNSKGYCFDSRVHMLMPNWWPCIPGWHHDDVPRSRGDGQPNYKNPEFLSKHCLALVNGDICPTEFAIGKTRLPHIDGVVYKEWHNMVESQIKEGVLERITVPSNRLVFFNHHSFHQGSSCIKKGWRWFGRITWDAGYEQGRPHANEVRRQVNVYMEHPMEGW